MSSVPVQQASLTFQTQTQDNATTLRLSGELAGTSALAARTALLEALQGRPRRLIADLTAVQALDEAGIGSLLIVTLWARKYGAELAIYPSPMVRDRLTAAKLDRYLRLTEPGSSQ